jgi:hypothetical protein
LVQALKRLATLARPAGWNGQRAAGRYVCHVLDRAVARVPLISSNCLLSLFRERRGAGRRGASGGRGRGFPADVVRDRFSHQDTYVPIGILEESTPALPAIFKAATAQERERVRAPQFAHVV